MYQANDEGQICERGERNRHLAIKSKSERVEQEVSDKRAALVLIWQQEYLKTD